MNNQPKLSIGLPVYNGEKFLAAALDSLLSQTFQDFEIIISDNASTDRTEDICKLYVEKDQRIRYYRNQTNIGCARNFNRVFELSNGEYFKWASHDDLHDCSFLSKCIEILDKDPSIVLCHSQVKFINEQGIIIGDYNIHLKTDSFKKHKRFEELLTKHLCYQIYGVIRSSCIKNTPSMGSFANPDVMFILRIALLGRFYEIPEHLFFARSHAQQSMSMFFPHYMEFTTNKPSYTLNMLPDLYGYAIWHDSRNKGKILFPHWQIFWEYLRSAWMGNMNYYERFRCHVSLITKLSGTEFLLIKDLFLAALMIWKRIPKLSISIKIQWDKPSLS